MPDVVIVDDSEARTWFREQLARRDPNGRRTAWEKIAFELRVRPSTITNNADRLKQGKPLGKTFRELVSPLVAAERLHTLGIEHLRKLRETQEASRREEAARAEAERIRVEQMAQAELMRIQAEKQEQERAALMEARRLWERQEAARLSLEPHLVKLRRDGVIADKDDELYGDAKELVEAGVTPISYPNRRVAAVALAPDDYIFPCGFTAAQLRDGVSSHQRLQQSIVPKGEPRPDWIGNRPAHLVPTVPYPDDKTFYGEDYDEITRYRELSASCDSLAKNPLPLIVFPEEAEEFEELVDLERHSPYSVEGSCLGEDPETRLRRIKRRAVVPGLIESIWHIAKWFMLLALLVAIVYLFFRISPWVWYILLSIGSWLYEWKWAIIAALVAVAFTIGIFCWARPRESDREWQFPIRVITIIGSAILTGFVALAFLMVTSSP